MAQKQELFRVTPEFVSSLRKYGQVQKMTPNAKACVATYRGRRLSSIQNLCGVSAALEAADAPKDHKISKISHWGNMVHVLQKLSLPVDDYILESIVTELGNIVQVETLKSIIQRIEHIQREVKDRTGQSSTFYNVAVNVRDKEGNVLLRTMNNIVVEGADEVFVFLVRSGRSNIAHIEKEFYVSLLSNLKQYPDKQVTLGMILAIKETQDMVIPVYWSASEELLHVPREVEAREAWYDAKFHSFIYATHKTYPKNPRDDLAEVGKPAVGENCVNCHYREFCEMYIQKLPKTGGKKNDKKAPERKAPNKKKEPRR